jgi:hypothetical protein
MNFQRRVHPTSMRLSAVRLQPGTVVAKFPLEGEPHVMAASDAAAVETTLGAGDAIAAFGAGPMNAHLLTNRGDTVRVTRSANELGFWGTQLPATYEAGQAYAFEVAGLAFSLGASMRTLEDLTSAVHYLRDPIVTTVSRGRRVSSPGLVDLIPDDGAIEVSAPKAPFDGVLPARILGLNPRWSAGLLLLRGYLAGFYGPAENRYRGLAVAVDGTAYVSIDTGRGESHLLAGHPIVADQQGKDLFIQVTCVGGNPNRWHVSVNNPGPITVRTVLRQTMHPRGLSFATRTVAVASGELLNLQ